VRNTTRLPMSSPYKICIGIAASIFMLSSVSYAYSQYMSNLKVSDDTKFIEGVKSVLDARQFVPIYKYGEFDCLDTSYTVQKLLTAKGYHAMVAYRFEEQGSSDKGHAWVVVPENNYVSGDMQTWIENTRWIMIETTAFAFGLPSLGRIVKSNRVAPLSMDAGYLTDNPDQYVLVVLGEQTADRLKADTIENKTALTVSVEPIQALLP
jgi:hypothetical protein